jgi:hypothetical protein
MAREEKSFQDLVKEAPVGGTVSLVGTLAQSSEAGKFVLNLQDGRAMTLETASVKGHTVLGTSVGQTIVRVDVDAATLPAGVPGATAADIYTPPPVDYTLASRDHYPKPFWQDAPPPYQFPFGGFAPFSLATPHQAPASTLAMQELGNPAFGGLWSGYLDNPIWSGYLDNPKIVYDNSAKILNDSGATGGPRFPD